MLYSQESIVGEHERRRLFKTGTFSVFLEPGTYRFYGMRKRHDVESFDLIGPAFTHPFPDDLVEAEPEIVEHLFTMVETEANEVAVVYYNERVAEVVAPAERKLHWKRPIEIRVDHFDLDEGLAIDAKLAKRFVSVGGELAGSLEPGAHAFWASGPNVNVDVLGHA